MYSSLYAERIHIQEERCVSKIDKSIQKSENLEVQSFHGKLLKVLTY